jgi:glycosyltransferase involved in cell wall biosynthesis
MKVLAIGTYPLGVIYGGVPTYTYMYAKYLSKNSDIKLNVITFGDENRKLEKENVTIHVINKKLFPLNVPFAIWQILKITKKINPDIINIIGTHFPNPTLALLLKINYRVVLTVIATISLEKRFYEIKSKYYGTSLFQIFNLARLEKLAVSKVDNVIVETPNVKRLLSRWTNANIYVIPDGVEFEEIQGINPTTEKVDILFVGRLVKVKGIDVLIKAISIVKKYKNDINLHILGYGPREDSIKDLTKKLNLEKNVKLLGFLSEKEKFEYFKGSKIVAIPSRWENSPITLYEAMASGKAVVASNVSGIPDVLINGKTGYLFETENAEELADKILILLKDSKLQKTMGESARKKAREYDWGKIIQKTVDTYKAIITEKK